jgi:hypothetical protein
VNAIDNAVAESRSEDGLRQHGSGKIAQQAGARQREHMTIDEIEKQRTDLPEAKQQDTDRDSSDRRSGDQVPRRQ